MGATRIRVEDRALHDRRITTELLIIDALLLVLAGLVTTWARFATFNEPVAIDVNFTFQYWQLSLAVAVLWVGVLWMEGLYDLERLAWDFVQVPRIARAFALGLVALILLTFVLKLPGLSRSWLLLMWFGSTVAVSAGRWVLQRWLFAQHRKGTLIYRTLVVGTNAEAARLAEILRDSHRHGLVPVGCLSENGVPAGACVNGLAIMGAASDAAAVVFEQKIDVVIIASSAFDHDSMAQMIADLRCAPVRTHISSGLFEVLTSRILVREIAGVPLITVKRIGFTPVRRAIKRAFDIVVAGTIVVLGLPLWLLVGLLVKLSSTGPTFYLQRRVGMDGRQFGMYKFRSMVEGAERMIDDLSEANEADGALFKMREDPRVTPWGRLMRRHSIDEFPQLINVLKGEMSLVGPRPPLPAETEAYDANHWRRMEVPPGMTGLWQVSGRSDLSFDEMVRLDLFYIENWSVGFDISLMLRTVPAVVSARGAY
ncbi:MAG: sugar transferase [Actinobacteria bacterium]|nr:sugar transferase [Actinomycetota bacterium]MCG2807401.1 sugar transferase [Coriobacteriia bacterium]